MEKLSTISNIALLHYPNVKSISHVTVNVTKVNAFLHKNKDKDEKLLYRIALTLMDLASRRVCNLPFPPPTFTLSLPNAKRPSDPSINLPTFSAHFVA